MADKRFSAQIDEIIQVNETRINALMRESVSEVINQAQLSVAKGGKMRVDTGFLRASGQLSLNDFPQGPVRPKEGEQFDKGDEYVAPPTVELELAKSEPGDTIFFGWTAEYAAARESRDGFLESAMQNWPTIVQNVTERIRKLVT